MSKIPLHRFPTLTDLRLLNSPNITNRVFEVITSHCPLLTHLEFGGKPEEYNTHLTLDGIKTLCGTMDEEKDEFSDEDGHYHDAMGLKGNLKVLKIYYCVKIGEKAIEVVNRRFWETLELLRHLKNSKRLEQLEIVYSRNFDWDCVKNLSSCCRNLRVLNLQDCPVQESFEPLAEGLPFLEELNMSGDSWVKEEALVGICKHPTIKIFHLGHFEHGDIDCLDIDEPEKGKFIGTLLANPKNLPSLERLHLEKCCLSMYIEDNVTKNRTDVVVEISQIFPIKMSDDSVQLS